MWDPRPVLLFESCSPQALRIWFAYVSYCSTSDTYPIDAHLEQLKGEDHVFLFLTWHRIGFFPERLKRYAEFPCQVILCANTPDEHAELRAAGVRCILFNHNAALDERTFRPTAPPGERCYDLVVNSAFAPYKRAHLAATVPRVASIGYRPDSEYHAAAPPLGTCLNQRGACYVYLSPAEVASSLASAAVGGVFSQEEGPCWAATEYLLCGLPVVTTPCRGGREVWLTQRNSITVEPTQEAVRDGVALAKELLRTGAFQPTLIREDALQLAGSFRATLVAEMQSIFGAHGVRADAACVFADRFSNKMGL